MHAIDKQALYTESYRKGYIVYGDGKLLYDSGEVKYDAATKIVNLSVTGIHQLKLVVDSCGANSYDHADWAGARA